MDPTLPTVIVEPGPISAADQSAAAALFADARRSFDARRYFEVLRTTEELLADFPASDVSGEGLRLTALSAVEVGDFAAADAAATQYLALLAQNDPRTTEMRITRARSSQGAPLEQVTHLLEIDDGAPTDDVARASELMRVAADSAALAELQAALDSAEVGSPLLPVADARLAVRLLALGQLGEAEAFAARAVSAGASGVDLEWAQAVLAGEFPDGRVRVTNFRIGVVLPLSGPPSLAEFAAQVAEGIEIAAATVLGEDFDVELVIRDNQADSASTATAVSQLEADGVHGIVGMLVDEALMTAADARTQQVPLISPTARSAAEAGVATYSLESSDPGAAASVGEYAASRGFQRVAIVYPLSAQAEVEAEAFTQAVGAHGIPVVGRFPYEVGATFFEEQIEGARRVLRAAELAALNLADEEPLPVHMLEPVAVFLPLPPEDVELLAPQLQHFGLDTLAIELLGTSGWTDPLALQAVDPRHTTGVVATAPVASEEEVPIRETFRIEYEERFRKSLVGIAPEIGYDAAALLLEALRPGQVGDGEVDAMLGSLVEVEGAGGVYSVIDGRVIRSTQLVRIEDRVPVPLTIRLPMN